MSTSSPASNSWVGLRHPSAGWSSGSSYSGGRLRCPHAVGADSPGGPGPSGAACSRLLHASAVPRAESLVLPLSYVASLRPSGPPSSDLGTMHGHRARVSVISTTPTPTVPVSRIVFRKFLLSLALHLKIIDQHSFRDSHLQLGGLLGSRSGVDTRASSWRRRAGGARFTHTRHREEHGSLTPRLPVASRVEHGSLTPDPGRSTVHSLPGFPSLLRWNTVHSHLTLGGARFTHPQASSSFGWSTVHSHPTQGGARFTHSLACGTGWGGSDGNVTSTKSGTFYQRIELTEKKTNFPSLTQDTHFGEWPRRPDPAVPHLPMQPPGCMECRDSHENTKRVDSWARYILCSPLGVSPIPPMAGL